MHSKSIQVVLGDDQSTGVGQRRRRPELKQQDCLCRWCAAWVMLSRQQVGVGDRRDSGCRQHVLHAFGARPRFGNVTAPSSRQRAVPVDPLEADCARPTVGVDIFVAALLMAVHVC